MVFVMLLQVIGHQRIITAKGRVNYVVPAVCANMIVLGVVGIACQIAPQVNILIMRRKFVRVYHAVYGLLIYILIQI